MHFRPRPIRRQGAHGWKASPNRPRFAPLRQGTLHPSRNPRRRSMQQDLFPAEPVAPVVQTGLFAEVVLDRPLEQVYTYAVGPDLAASIAIGKRVRVPFGRGDKAL